MHQTIHKEDLRSVTESTLPWDALYGKSILVTGANGFIASFIVEILLLKNESLGDKKIHIFCLVRDQKAAKEQYKQYRNRKDITFLVQDVCDPLIKNVCADYIIHAASYATPSKYGRDPVGTLLPNVLGTYHLLEYAKKHTIQRFLFISSCEVYGDTRTAKGGTVSETFMGSLDPLSLRSSYGEGKRMGETMCKAWSTQYGVPVAIVRLFHTFGPGMSLGDGRVHSDFVNDIVREKNIIMKSSGQARRSFCYISDAVAGIFTVLLKGQNGEAYNVGNDHVLSVRELAKLLLRLSGNKTLRITQDLRSKGKRYLESPVISQYPDISKIRGLGWSPRFTAAAGFRRTLDSYHEGQ